MALLSAGVFVGSIALVPWCSCWLSASVCQLPVHPGTSSPSTEKNRTRWGNYSRTWKVVLRSATKNLKSTLVQVMVWCRQAASQYLSQCWSRSMSSKQHKETTVEPESCSQDSDWADLTSEKSTLVQVMAWCRQAPSHYLSQWWPRSMLPYGITRHEDTSV